MSTPIGRNKLRLTINKLTSYFPYLRKKFLSNKMGQGVGITHMEKAMYLKNMVWR
jgi:hypothetical protein